MIPQTAIVQIAKRIGRELNSSTEPSEDALAAGPILAEAGATPEIVGRLFAEAQRNRRNDRMIHAYAFMLEGALGTLRVQASGEDVGADHTSRQCTRRSLITSGRAASHLTSSCWWRVLLRAPSLIQGGRCRRR